MHIKRFPSLFIDGRETASKSHVQPTYLVTHAHGDHLVGFRGGSGIIYTTVGTARALRKKKGFDRYKFRIRILEIDHKYKLQLFDGTEVIVTPFHVDHDCPGACGYLLEGLDGRRVMFTGDFKFSHGWLAYMAGKGYMQDLGELYFDGTFWGNAVVQSDMTKGHSSWGELVYFLE